MSQSGLCNSVESFDGIEAECSRLRILVLADVKSLERSCDSIRNGIADMWILQALKVVVISEVTADDMDLRSLESLE